MGCSELPSPVSEILVLKPTDYLKKEINKSYMKQKNELKLPSMQW